jgi:uncharacterized phiE125 gp8 family phage protein
VTESWPISRADFDQIKHFTQVTTGPTDEPVTLEEAKLSARVSGIDEDGLIESWIILARELVEIDSRRALLAQTVKLYMDRLPERTIYLERPPVQSVTSIQYVDTDGSLQTLSATKYVTDLVSEPCRLTPAYGIIWPFTRWQTNAVTITFVAGWAAVNLVPERAKQAIKLLVGHWYRNREAVGTVAPEIEFSYSSCVSRLAWGVYV